MDDKSTIQLSCMEIWGGNTNVYNRVELEGVNAWVCCIPYGHSDRGGDIHYMTSCASGRITRILVADVSGHGALVAAHAVQLKRLMRRYSNYINQQKLVRNLNRSFSEYTSQGKFATAIAMTFFSPTGILSISNAGHPPPFIYKASKKQWEVINTKAYSKIDPSGERTDLPFGVLNNAVYSQSDLQLENNDIVLIYTDSLIDVRNKEGDPIGVNGALELLQSITNTNSLPNSDTMIDQIKSKLGIDPSTNPEAVLDDDMTLLLFTPKHIGNIKWSRKIASLWLMMKAFTHAMFTRGEPFPWPELSLRNIGGAFINILNKLKK